MTLLVFTLRGQKYGNNVPNNAASEMTYEVVENVLSYFCTKIKADVTQSKCKYRQRLLFPKYSKFFELFSYKLKNFKKR